MDHHFRNLFHILQVSIFSTNYSQVFEHSIYDLRTFFKYLRPRFLIFQMISRTLKICSTASEFFPSSSDISSYSHIISRTLKIFFTAPEFFPSSSTLLYNLQIISKTLKIRSIISGFFSSFAGLNSYYHIISKTLTFESIT